MKMTCLFVAAIALAAVSGSMAADAGRKLKSEYVSSAAGGRRLSQATDYQAVGQSYADAANAIAESYQNEGQNYQDVGQQYADAANAVAAQYQNAGAPPRVPTCYAPYSNLACGAQSGLECYDAGGSDDNCAAYYCCQPAAGGRKLSQATDYQAVGQNYADAANAIAESYQGEGQNYQAVGQNFADVGQNFADLGQNFADAGNAVAAQYTPPRVPTCYAPYSNLACGAQTGLECYDAGGSDDNCAAYYCCQPAAGGRKLSQATDYQSIGDSYVNAANAIAESYQGEGQNYQDVGQNYADAANAVAESYQNEGQNYQDVGQQYADAANAVAAQYTPTNEGAPPRVPTCYAPYSNLACGAQTGLQCYDAGGSDDKCSAYYCCQPQ